MLALTVGFLDLTMINMRILSHSLISVYDKKYETKTSLNNRSKLSKLVSPLGLRLPISAGVGSLVSIFVTT